MTILSKIVAANLGFSYEGLYLFRHVDLDLPENRIIALTGPSGTGKSTFLTLFNRLWQESGGGEMEGAISIRFKGGCTDIYRDECQSAELRRKVGMVFQAPNPLPMSIYDNVAFPLKLSGYHDRRLIAEKVEATLRRTHLFPEVKDRLRMDARKLSGGQQQRLCIARAMMLEPEILLLDEPTSSLDDKSCKKIEELLLALKNGCTLLMVSHYQDQVQRVADQVYRLADQRIVRMS